MKQPVYGPTHVTPGDFSWMLKEFEANKRSESSPLVRQYVSSYVEGMCNVCGVDTEGVFWHAGEDGVLVHLGYVHDAEYTDEPRVYALQPYVNLWILSDADSSILFVQGSDAEIEKGIGRSKQMVSVHRVK